jgi:hypothetical protein
VLSSQYLFMKPSNNVYCLSGMFAGRRRFLVNTLVNETDFVSYMSFLAIVLLE